MHMADALLSPIVGSAMIATTVGFASWSIRKIQKEMDNKKIPLMGVMGAFIFAAQMINFTIPGTGSSGHIGGGMLLSIMLGPFAGFLTMACVLIIQAMFFGDGGLLALGANIFNLGVFTCFFAYPLIYKRFMRKGITPKRIFIASMISAVIALQMGAFAVVMETVVSGRTELDLKAFLLMMQPIHLAIGLVEGLVTSAVVSFIWKARPEILDNAISGKKESIPYMRKVIVAILVVTILTGGGLSLFASKNPDGLEWSLAKVAATTKDNLQGGIYKITSEIQKKTTIFPDYQLSSKLPAPFSVFTKPSINKSIYSDRNSGIAGIIGGMFTLLMIILIGGLIRIKKKFNLLWQEASSTF